MEDKVIVGPMTRAEDHFDDLGFKIFYEHEGVKHETLGHGCDTLAEARAYAKMFAHLGTTCEITDQARCDEITEFMKPKTEAKRNTKKWPKDGAAVDFEKLASPLRSAFKFMFDCKRKNADKDVPYRGYGVGRVGHVAIDVPELLSAEYLNNLEEGQGRDALDCFIQLCLQVGIEQGHRIAMSSSELKRLKILAELGELNLQAAHPQERP